ncbi:hypothetical protein FSP39_009495 [Pinctada imbricata]|uniref:Interleukin 17-like protein n=1 Tax=Pinctada imbricata TaxID=66713 RepID=A0AA89BWN5_PINIB|nr:hypothetical protein FSP39_009495 [Pinctada imbricata]
MFIFQIVVSLVSSHVVSNPLPLCQEPENIHDIFVNMAYQHPMLYSLQPGFNQNQYYIRQEGRQQETYLNGIQNCPNSQTNLNVTITSPLSERATCPFYFVSTFDARRYPQRITEARCSCIQCLEYHGLSHRNKCEPVYRDVKVLVKTECQSNVWQYSSRIYKKQESCTCAVQPRIRHTENRDQNTAQPIPV